MILVIMAIVAILSYAMCITWMAYGMRQLGRLTGHMQAIQAFLKGNKDIPLPPSRMTVVIKEDDGKWTRKSTDEYEAYVHK